MREDILQALSELIKEKTELKAEKIELGLMDDINKIYKDAQKLSSAAEGKGLNDIRKITLRVESDFIQLSRKAEQGLELIQKVVREEYLKILENEIAKAFVSAYEEQAQSLFDTYLDNAEAHTTRQRIKDRVTKEEREPDENFMRSIVT